MSTILTPQEDARMTAASVEPAEQLVGQLRMASESAALLERISFASKHGFSYEGERDLNKGLGRVSQLTISNYRARYRRGGIFKRMIRAAPKATWVSGATFQEDPDPETETKFEAEAKALFERLNAWGMLLRADILAGLGRYSALLIGGEGRATELEQELSFGTDGPMFLRPLAEDRAQVDEIDKDSTSKRFGLPKLYKITLDADGSRRSSTSDLKVHWTRVLHIVDDPLESNVYGVPRGEATWDLFDDLYKVVGGGAEAAWKMMDPGLNLDIDPELPVTPADVAKLKAELLAYQHDPQKRYFMSRGVDVKQLTPSVTNFGANAKSLLELIAGTEEIPLRILLGSERGELASSQDERNWNKRIEERWALFAEPLVRTLVDRFIEFKALPMPAEYQVILPEAAELDDAETAELASKIAAGNKAQVDAGDTLFYTSEEIRRDLYGKEPLEDAGGGENEPVAGLRGAAASSEMDAVREAALAAEPAHEALWRGLWAAMEDALPTDAVLTSAIEKLDAEAVTAEVENDKALDDLLSAPLDLIDAAVAGSIEEFEEPLRARLSETLTDGAERSLDVIEERGSYLLDGDLAFAPAVNAWKIAGAFDAVNPRAVEWAATQAAELVTAIPDATRVALRSIISRGLAAAFPPARIALMIRNSIGLREDQAVAAVSLASKLAAARPGSTVRAGGLKFKVPKSGASSQYVDRSMARYSKKALRSRAELIRQTETSHAANAGLRENWRQAQAAGDLPKTVKRVWITSGDDRVRPSHAEVDGEEVGVDEDFSLGAEPGEEPRCRCGQGLV